MESTKEAITIALEAKLPSMLFHHNHPKYIWPKDRALLDKALDEGIEIYPDVIADER